MSAVQGNAESVVDDRGGYEQQDEETNALHDRGEYEQQDEEIHALREVTVSDGGEEESRGSSSSPRETGGVDVEQDATTRAAGVF